MYFPNRARFSDIGHVHFCCTLPLLSHHTLIINAFYLVTLICCCSNKNVMKQFWCGVTPEASHIVKWQLVKVGMIKYNKSKSAHIQPFALPVHFPLQWIPWLRRQPVSSLLPRAIILRGKLLWALRGVQVAWWGLVPVHNCLQFWLIREITGLVPWCHIPNFLLIAYFKSCINFTAFNIMQINKKSIIAAFMAFL